MCLYYHMCSKPQLIDFKGQPKSNSIWLYLLICNFYFFLNTVCLLCNSFGNLIEYFHLNFYTPGTKSFLKKLQSEDSTLEQPGYNKLLQWFLSFPQHNILPNINYESNLRAREIDRKTERERWVMKKGKKRKTKKDKRREETEQERAREEERKKERKKERKDLSSHTQCSSSIWKHDLLPEVKFAFTTFTNPI